MKCSFSTHKVEGKKNSENDFLKSFFTFEEVLPKTQNSAFSDGRIFDTQVTS